MCLESKLTKKDKANWLKDKPEEITAYKVMITRTVKGEIRLAPPFNNGIYKRTNMVRAVTSEQSGKCCYTSFRGSIKSTTYMAYFHFFIDKEEAKSWAMARGQKMVECKILKKYVTEIGRQWNKDIMVARKFSIVRQNRYLD
jgi:hypothetical protein